MVLINIKKKLSREEIFEIARQNILDDKKRGDEMKETIRLQQNEKSDSVASFLNNYIKAQEETTKIYKDEMISSANK